MGSTARLTHGRFKTWAPNAAHDFRYALDYCKIKEELGWKPRIDFEEGLERTVEWHLANQDWVESVITGEYQEYYQRVYGADEK